MRVSCKTTTQHNTSTTIIVVELKDSEAVASGEWTAEVFVRANFAGLCRMLSS